MILDIIVIVIFLICVIIGCKRGAFRTMSTFVLSLIAFALSIYLADVLSVLLFDNVISMNIIDNITSSLSETADSIDIQTIVSAVPLLPKLCLTLSGVDLQAVLTDSISDAPSFIAATVCDALRPLVISLLKFILSILLYFIIYFIFRLVIAKLLKKLFSMPILKQLDSVLGFLGGVFMAFLIVTVCAFLLSVLTPYVDNMPFIFSESTIYNSYIFYHFYSGNIFKAII